MLKEKMRTKLINATDIEEVKAVLSEMQIDHTQEIAEHILQEFKRRRTEGKRKLDLDEMDAVAGGADRNWAKDGCAATCEWGSWCGSNDYCYLFSVTYDDYYITCPDGHQHEFKDKVCQRCGYSIVSYDDKPWE
jgi:hypothetical protein